MAPLFVPPPVQIAADGGPAIAPGALYLDGSYALRVNAWCDVAGVVLGFRSRFLRSRDRQLVNSTDAITLNATRALVTRDFQQPVGYPVDVQLIVVSGTPTIGQAFVQVQIVSGQGPAAIPLATVLQGYITGTQALGYPGSPIQNSLDGQGAVESYDIAIPPPGGDFGIAVPIGARWEVVAASALYSASGAPGNRDTALELGQPFTFVVRSPVSVSILATQAPQIGWMAGFGSPVLAPNGNYAFSLPADLRLAGGGFVQSQTAGMDAGDQWFGPSVTVRAWIDV